MLADLKLSIRRLLHRATSVGELKTTPRDSFLGTPRIDEDLVNIFPPPFQKVQFENKIELLKRRFKCLIFQMDSEISDEDSSIINEFTAREGEFPLMFRC